MTGHLCLCTLSTLQYKLGLLLQIATGTLCFGAIVKGWIGWSSTDPSSSSHPPPCKKPLDVSNLARINTDTGLLVWETNEVEHCPQNASCPNCGLVCLHISNHRVPSVLFRKLTPGRSTLNESIKCTLQLPKNVPPDPTNFCIKIFPKECEQGVCGCHYLLVGYLTGHLLCYLMPAEFSCVSELPMINLPMELASWSGSLLNDLCPSTDGSVVAFLHGAHIERYHVWEPESGRVISVRLPHIPCCSWLATGKLYSILEGKNEFGQCHFAVIETYTGVVLILHTCTALMSRLPPADQSWLSTFDTPEHLPIAMYFQTNLVDFQTNVRLSIGSIIARRSV